MLTTTQPRVEATDRLRLATAEFMQIDDTTYGEGGQYAVRFRGRLTKESTQAYAQAADSFRALGYTPLFRNENGAHVVLAVPGTIDPSCDARTSRSPSRTGKNQ